MDSYYDIYSSGELASDANPTETRAALARLFKTSEDKIAHLMTGKPQLIKRRVEKAEALRYKSVLQQAGLLVIAKLSEPAPAAISTAETTPATFVPATPTQTASAQPISEQNINQSASTSAAQTSHYDFSIAPAGSDILHADEKTHVEVRQIDTSTIKLAPVSFMTETAAATSVAAPDTSHLSIAEVGSILGRNTEQPPLPAPDISHLSVADVGAALDEIKPDVMVLNPDISGLSIAETGVDLIPADYHKPAPPPPPATDHLTLQAE